VFGRLLGASPAETVARFGVSLNELRPQRLFAAAAAHAEVSGQVKVEPFDAEALDALQAALLAPTAFAKATDALGGGPDVRAMVERVLGPVRAELAALQQREGRVDPKKLLLLPIAGQAVL
jgi:hypothetical protein